MHNPRPFRRFLKNLLKNSMRVNNPRVISRVMSDLGFEADINTVRDILNLAPIPDRYFTRLGKAAKRQGKLVCPITIWNHYWGDHDMRMIKFADDPELLGEVGPFDYSDHLSYDLILEDILVTHQNEHAD